MRCEKCNMELVALESNQTLSYWCRTCHTIEMIGKNGKSLGVFAAK
jgi:hypothetical protein